MQTGAPLYNKDKISLIAKKKKKKKHPPNLEKFGWMDAKQAIFLIWPNQHLDRLPDPVTTINHGELFLSNVVIMACSNRPVFATNELRSRVHLPAFVFTPWCVRLCTAFIKVFAWTVTFTPWLQQKDKIGLGCCQ